MNNKEINPDDICDIYSKKICDNCGKCLEIDGVDIKAINIEDIAKNLEENQYLEDQLNEAKELLKLEEELVNNTDDKNSSIEYIDDIDSNADSYIDAFDDIVYFDDIGIDDESNLDDLTEEVYPGIRRFKK